MHIYINMLCISTIGSEDDIDENETSIEDTLDIVSTLDFRMNGSVANGTIRTIPKPIKKTNEYLNEKNSLPYPLPRTASVNTESTKFPPQNNLGFQRIPDEIPVLNNFHGSVDSNLEHAKSSISQNATAPTAYDDKLALQSNCNFAPLHVECDPVGNSLVNVYCNLSLNVTFIFVLFCEILICVSILYVFYI